MRKEKQEKAGQFQEETGQIVDILKDRLTVDKTYQRERRINEPTIKSIIKNWDIAKAGVLTVNQRANGQLCIIDGQGRYLAAMQIDSIETLPCKLTIGLTVEEEARLFLVLNKIRKSTTPFDDFHARLAANDPEANHLHTVLLRSGYSISPQRHGHKMVRCVSTVVKYHKRNPMLFKDIWPLCADLHAPGLIYQENFMSLFNAEEILRKQNGTLLEESNQRKLFAVGTEKLRKEINNANCSFGSVRHGTIGSVVIINIVNARRNWKNKYKNVIV